MPMHGMILGGAFAAAVIGLIGHAIWLATTVYPKPIRIPAVWPKAKWC